MVCKCHVSVSQFKLGKVTYYYISLQLVGHGVKMCFLDGYRELTVTGGLAAPANGLKPAPITDRGNPEYFSNVIMNRRISPQLTNSDRDH